MVGPQDNPSNVPVSQAYDGDPSLASAQDIARTLAVDPKRGLDEAEVKDRLKKFGFNKLAEAPQVPGWKKFLLQFKDPLVYLLLAATAISLVAWFIERAHSPAGSEESLPFDAIVIVLILVLNAVLGYIQEARAEQAVDALARMTAPQTSVLRGGRVLHVDTTEVVPGDILVLSEGNPLHRPHRH